LLNGGASLHLEEEVWSSVGAMATNSLPALASNAQTCGRPKSDQHITKNIHVRHIVIHKLTMRNGMTNSTRV
jgi:hypothetical protein